jgi:hypothetical protein
MAVTGYSTTPGSNNGSPPNGAPEGMGNSFRGFHGCNRLLNNARLK